MNVLLATNILAWLIQGGHAHQPLAVTATDTLDDQEHQVCVARLVNEFYVEAQEA
jgi:hypothetical protein